MKSHPESVRDKSELAELDAKDTIPVAGRSIGARNMHDDDDDDVDDDGSEEDYDGYDDDDHFDDEGGAYGACPDCRPGETHSHVTCGHCHRVRKSECKLKMS